MRGSFGTMSNISVDEIQSEIASVIDQDESTSNIDSTDYSLRLRYINRALKEWAEIQDWQTLYREYNMLVSTSTGNASIVLPANFRKLASYPLITHDGRNTDQFPEVLPQEDRQYSDTDKRVWIIGNSRNGYLLRVLGVSLSSGASVKVPYYASPQSLVSPADIADIPNPDYLVQRTIALVWEADEDARYPQAKTDAENILRNMIEYENVFNRASQYDRVKTVEETKYSFRMGRD